MAAWCRVLLGCLLGLSALHGCAARRAAENVAGAEGRLGSVRIRGNRALTDDEIREHLYLQGTTWFPLPRRRYFYPAFVPEDAERIEELYATRGYFAAEVVDVEIKRHRNGRVADVVFVVDEGPPTIVDSIDHAWPEGPPGGPPDRRVRRARIETRRGLQAGEPFSVKEMHQSAATMRVALQSRGYAFASVDARAEVDRPARSADVHFELRPGPWARIGDIRIEGLRLVPEHLVRNEVEQFEGKPFSPRRLQSIEDAIYGLEIFSSVTVLTVQNGRKNSVDIVVRVTEGKPQSIRVGLGLGLDPIRWEQYLATRYRHYNLFGNLTRLQLGLRAGYAELPALYNPREHGPIGVFEPSLRKKGFLEKKLVWLLEPRFEVGIQQGYQFWSPSYRAGVSRFFTRFVEVGLAHNLRYVDFFAISPTLDSRKSLLGLDFRDPYMLSYISTEGWLHFTDRIVNPRNGVRAGVAYDLAGGFVGGQFDYNKITPEIRGYYTPLKNRLQFAARAQAGLIIPFGDEPGAPFDLQYYLGGAATVRGFGLRRLSPTVEDCEDDGDCDRVPIGGNTMVLGNFETRARVWRDLWAVAFFDMGDVQSDVTEFRPGQWNYAVGPGLRYKSRIGTFRVDVGFRLNQIDRFEGEPIWALHFGLGEPF